LEAARHITRLGAAKVILGVRSVSKGETAKKSIEESTKTNGVVEVWQLDLSSYASVEEFAARANKLARLDVLLCNAGIATQEWNLAEGNEATITVNVVSTYLLALLCLPRLKETAQQNNKQTYSVIVSSEVHFMTKLPYLRKDPNASIFDVLNDKNANIMGDRYNASKLLEVFSSRQMVADYCPSKEYPVITNFLTPGLCHSELMREAAFLGRIVKFILGARTTEVGSRTLVHATQAGPESHGQYLSDCTVTAPSPFVTSKEGKDLQAKVWKDLSEKLEGIHPGIFNNF